MGKTGGQEEADDQTHKQGDAKTQPVEADDFRVGVADQKIRDQRGNAGREQHGIDKATHFFLLHQSVDNDTQNGGPDVQHIDAPGAEADGQDHRQGGGIVGGALKDDEQQQTHQAHQAHIQEGCGITADGKIDEDELSDFMFIQEELERISITVETLQLWSEQMLESGKIDVSKYNEYKKAKNNATLAQQACELATKCETVVLFIGLTEEFESEGFDRRHLGIPALHTKLVDAVTAVNENVVVAISGGSAIEMPWADKVKGILNCVLGGEASGSAAADILFGDVNPSGKLSETYPLALSDNSSYNYFPGTPVSVEFDNTATVAKLDNNTEKLTFDCPSCTDESPVFFTVIQSGFPTETYSHSNGIEIIREYYNENGDRVSSAKLGDTLTAKISVRATRGNVPNVAIVDLLPGGMTARDLDAKSANFSEIRTDRVLIFTDLTRSHSEYTYTIQITAAGTFQSPSISAMSMYNPETSATYTPYNSTFTVSNAQPD